MKKELLKFYFNKYQIFIWPAIGIIVSSSFLILLIIPQITSVGKSDEDISQLKERSTLLNQKLVQLQAIDVAKYRENLNTVLIALPLDKDIPSAISQIQNLAGSNRLEIVEFTIAAAGPTVNSATSYQVKIDLAGDLASIKNFIEQLKQAPRVMTIEKATLAGTKNSLIYQASLAIDVYRQPQQTNLGGLEDPVTALSDSNLSLLARLSKAVKNIPLVSSSNATGPKGKVNPFE